MLIEIGSELAKTIIDCAWILGGACVLSVIVMTVFSTKLSR